MTAPTQAPPGSPLAGLRPPAGAGPRLPAPPRRPGRRVERPPVGRRGARRAPSPPGPAVDPRIAARREEVQRDQGRRRWRRIAVLVVVAAVVAGAAGLTRTPLLDVDRIDVVGAERTPADDVLGAAGTAGLLRGLALIDVDVAAVAQAVAELPWVEEVSVRRDWPGTVRVSVVERVAVGALAAPDGTALLAADGTVLEVVPGATDGVVALAEVAPPPAPGGTVDDATAALARVAAAIPPVLRPSVVAVVPSPAGAGLVLSEASGAPEGARVELGRTPVAGEAFVAVATTLEQVDLTCLALLDVRVPTAFVLTRTPTCP